MGYVVQGIGIEFVDLELFWNSLFSGVNGNRFECVLLSQSMELEFYCIQKSSPLLLSSLSCP